DCQTATHSRRSASFVRPPDGAPHACAPDAPGEEGTPVAHLHAPGHLRWLVARRARRGARRSVRRVLRPKRIAPGAALDSICGLCALAAAVDIAPPARCAARILARAASPAATGDAFAKVGS